MARYLSSRHKKEIWGRVKGEAWAVCPLQTQAGLVRHFVEHLGWIRTDLTTARAKPEAQELQAQGVRRLGRRNSL